MTQFIVLNKEDIKALNHNQPVSVISRFDNTEIVVCTKEYFEEQRKGGTE